MLLPTKPGRDDLNSIFQERRRKITLVGKLSKSSRRCFGNVPALAPANFSLPTAHTACHNGTCLLGVICQHTTNLKHLLLVACLQEAQGLDHLLLVTACLQEAQGPAHLLLVTACLKEAQAAAPKDPKMQWMRKMTLETQWLLPLTPPCNVWMSWPTSWTGQGGTTTGATEPPLGGN